MSRPLASGSDWFKTPILPGDCPDCGTPLFQGPNHFGPYWMLMKLCGLPVRYQCSSCGHIIEPELRP